VSTWIIGDVQGCFDSLSALLELLEFEPARDRLWLAGDLVNRGPRSLEVLRWAEGLHADRGGEGIGAVLGNHDLHLLACAAGAVEERGKDTFQPVLALPSAERERLVDWLRARPFVVREGGALMVHAGLWPGWSHGEAAVRAVELEAALRGESWGELLAAWRRPRAERRIGWASVWHDGLQGEERLVTLLEVFTRMRCLDAAGQLAMDYAGPPRGRPAGLEPWYAARDDAEGTVFFGHWAAHGYQRGEGWVALDSGCVWGGALTAHCLEDGRVVRQPAVD
jgi:bis(5'-nucleosyl)-tetraphosphatase (symmetrical)